MALNITTGAGSLVSIGMSLGDVSTLYALGRRYGNWVTAHSGDVEFLDLLQSDELDILRRRGMIDVARFNKRWAQRVRLLMNGRPLELAGKKAADIVGPLSRFTASMVAVVAALDGFMSYTVLRDVIKRLLKELLRTTEYGEDVLTSQLGDRVNAWRSAAYVRSLSLTVQTMRQDMVASHKVLNGYMPAGDAGEMAEFLFWLLAGDTEAFRTASSDVAGVAVVLSQLAFDILSVDAWGSQSSETGCRLLYSPDLVVASKWARGLPQGHAEFFREQTTIVPLHQPEEAFSTFAISASICSAARQAWTEGEKAAEYVYLRVKVKEALERPREQGEYQRDLEYEVVDLGSALGRICTEIFALAKLYGLCVNAELCQRLSNIFERTDAATLAWLSEQDGVKAMLQGNIADADMQDQKRIDTFTIYQAFIFGYYYAIFLRLVDISGLAIPTVEGAWGFRSAEAMEAIRSGAIKSSLTRENLLVILATLLFSHPVDIPVFNQRSSCLGIVGKRALLVNSLVTKSDTVEDVGKFTLLDVDIGGIPCNADGLVRPGEAPNLESDWFDFALTKPKRINPKGPISDFTKHLEPDWDVDPDTVLLVMRYRGRRVATINPSVADKLICEYYVGPVENAASQQEVPVGVEYTVENFLSGKALFSNDNAVKVVVQSKDMPGMRYATVGSFPRLPRRPRDDLDLNKPLVALSKRPWAIYWTFTDDDDEADADKTVPSPHESEKQKP